MRSAGFSRPMERRIRGPGRSGSLALHGELNGPAEMPTGPLVGLSLVYANGQTWALNAQLTDSLHLVGDLSMISGPPPGGRDTITFIRISPF